MQLIDLPAYFRLSYSVDAYLRAKGMEVVNTEWRGQMPGAEYLVLTVKRVVAPPLEPCAFCEHAKAVHEAAGPCWGVDCLCEVYCPPLDASQ